MRNILNSQAQNELDYSSIFIKLFVPRSYIKFPKLKRKLLNKLESASQ